MSWLRKATKVKESYQAVFLTAGGNMTQQGRIVIEDLANFGDVYSANVTNDPISMARHQGRLDMYNRILGHVHYQHERWLSEQAKLGEHLHD